MSLGGIVESLFDPLPVDDLPYVLEEVGLRVFVVNVEGVLPDVDIQKGGEAAGLLVGDQVLVLRGAVLQRLRLLVVHEPAPAGALDGRRLRRKVRLEGVVGPPGLLDQLGEVGGVAWALATATLDRGERVPEERVVPVAATEEADLTGDPRDGRVVLLGHGLLDLIDLLIVLDDVGLMVTVIVVVHLRLCQHGLQVVQGPGQRCLRDLGCGDGGSSGEPAEGLRHEHAVYSLV